IKVGSVAAVTGPIAELVATILASRNHAAEHVNSQGGLLNGDTLKLVIADSQCDPKAGVDAGTKVINVEQVVAIIGPNCSGATNALAQSVSIPAGVVIVSDTATDPAISDLEDNDTVFRVAASGSYQGAALARLARDAGYKKLAVTFANDDYNAGLAEVFAREFVKLGGEITANQMHEPKKPSYRSELATLSGNGAEGLALFAYYGGSGITIVRNALENNLFDKFVGAEGLLDQSVIDQIGADALRGRVMLTHAKTETESPSFQAYSTSFKAAGFNPESTYAAHAYDATFLVALAIEKAGSADRSLISAALREVASPPGMIIRPGEWAKAKAAIAAGEDINYEGAAGVNDFDEKGDVTANFVALSVGADNSWVEE
ncbi:MAG: ABC transporter substrate-binding protein, partial [Fimbriimonadaceae bacterium]|nr:ABC transporter substrate-binding protein [Alphaproteobacteria bacterium]